MQRDLAEKIIEAAGNLHEKFGELEALIDQLDDAVSGGELREDQKGI